MMIEPNFPRTNLMDLIPERLLQLSQDGFFVMDLGYRYLFWSDGMQRITGISEAEVLGKNAFDVFPFLHEIGQDQVFESVFTCESTSTKARPFTIPESGRKGYFDAHYYPFREEGQVVGLLAIVTDVTELKRSASLNAETESRFRNMADSSPVMLWMSGTDALCNFFNHSWLEFSGKPMAAELGAGWAEGVHAFDFQRCMDTYMSSFRERKPFEMEYRLLRNDGEYRWILDRGTPRYAPDGTFEGYIGSCIDITERKMLEDELRKSIHLREEFLSIASHELKTPLTSLSLQIQVFRHLFQKTDDLNKIRDSVPPMIDVADRQLRHMADLIEKFLDISRIETGNFNMDMAEMDLVRTIAEISERLTPIANQAGCTLTYCGPDSLYGFWDRARMEQVVSNLLTNAIKYAAKSAIEIRLRADKKTAVLEVEDHGAGIPSEVHSRIFEKFFCGSPGGNTGGLGLGLFAVREIVLAHGGTISAMNGPEHGAIFRVELPL